MQYREYGDFPTLKEIKQDYKKLLKIIKNVRTIEQAKVLENQGFTVEINGMSIDEFTTPGSDGYICTNNDIEWIRYEVFGCLTYIYDRFDGKPWFDVWCNYSLEEFITDITIDKLTPKLYEEEKARHKRFFD